MRSLIKYVQQRLRKAGLDIRRFVPQNEPGEWGRPIGELEKFFEDLIQRGFKPKGIVDVGAHSGAWTRSALSYFPGAASIMIEPQVEMAPHLASIVAEYPGSAHVQAGAGRVAGELVQTIWSDFAGSSFLPPTEENRLASGEQRPTRIVTIDEILAERPDFSPDLIKLDVQGFELEALAGAASTFGRTEVYILEAALYVFEKGMPLAREVIHFMADRGYELYDVPGFGRRPSDGAVAHLDLAFARSRGVLRKNDIW